MQWPSFLIPRLHHLIQPQHSLASSVPRRTGLCLEKITSRETALFLYIPATVNPKVPRSFLCADWVDRPTSGRLLVLWPTGYHLQYAHILALISTLQLSELFVGATPALKLGPRSHLPTQPQARGLLPLEVRARRCTSLGPPLTSILQAHFTPSRDFIFGPEWFLKLSIFSNTLQSISSEACNRGEVLKVS